MKKLTLGALIAVSISLGGCAQLKEAAAKLEKYQNEQKVVAYNKVVDKSLVDKFYTINSDGSQTGLVEPLKSQNYEMATITPTIFAMKKSLFNEPNWNAMNSKIYNYSIDPVDESIAKIYVEHAKARGSEVKLYKPMLSSVISNVVLHPFSRRDAGNSKEWYNLDNVLIEYNTNGEIISFLVRGHQATNTLGVIHSQYTTIHSGKAAGRQLENKIPNSKFSDSYIRTL